MPAEHGQRWKNGSPQFHKRTEWAHRENAPTSKSQTRTLLGVCARSEIERKVQWLLEKVRALLEMFTNWKIHRLEILKCLHREIAGVKQGPGFMVCGSKLNQGFWEKGKFGQSSRQLYKGGGLANTKKVWMSPHFSTPYTFRETTSWVYLPKWLAPASLPSFRQSLGGSDC